MDTQTWIIDEAHAGKRLDVFLTEQLAPLTRSAIKKRIEQGHFFINGTEATVHQFLKIADKVEVIEARKTSEATQKLATRLIPEIVAETADWMVLNKPSGLLVHPARHTTEPTLIDWLMEHDAKIGRVGENPERPGIVHRLDREVSGLMLVAKTQAAYDALHKQFAQHTIKKHYLALVHGDIPKEEDDIKLRIARSSTKARMAARPASEESGKAAWTHYRLKRRFHGASLLDLEILSGRTHQIRAHLHGIGHPVIGDPLYTRKQTDRRLTPPRIMLQSVELSFTDPTTDEVKTYSIEADPAFAVVSQQLAD